MHGFHSHNFTHGGASWFIRYSVVEIVRLFSRRYGREVRKEKLIASFLSAVMNAFIEEFLSLYEMVEIVEVNED
jgi:hypothetical protein